MQNEIWFYFLVIWNILVSFLYGWDKFCAKKHWRRIPESVLLCSALLLGSVGAMFGMVLWNHKTSKMKFRIVVPAVGIMHLILFGILI